MLARDQQPSLPVRAKPVPGATIVSAPSTHSPARTPRQLGGILLQSSIAQFHKSIQKIVVKGWNDLLDLTWAADGKALYVVAGIRAAHVLLHVDLQGRLPNLAARRSCLA